MTRIQVQVWTKTDTGELLKWYISKIANGSVEEVLEDDHIRWDNGVPYIVEIL